MLYCAWHWGKMMRQSPLQSVRSVPDDGTRQLLTWGASMVGAGMLSAVLLETVLGGFTPTGAQTNGGWFALIVALMALPFGGLLLMLGVAKAMRNRGRSASEMRSHEAVSNESVPTEAFSNKPVKESTHK